MEILAEEVLDADQYNKQKPTTSGHNTESTMENKLVYFNAGDLVRVKATIPYRPVMLVKKVNRFRYSDKADMPKGLIDVTCCWFTADGLYQETKFSTKDLEHVNNG